MEVLNLLTTNQFLQNSSKILQKSSRMSPKILKNHPKIKFAISYMSAAGLLGLYLVEIKCESSLTSPWLILIWFRISEFRRFGYLFFGVYWGRIFWQMQLCRPIFVFTWALRSASKQAAFGSNPYIFNHIQFLQREESYYYRTVNLMLRNTHNAKENPENVACARAR